MAFSSGSFMFEMTVKEEDMKHKFLLLFILSGKIEHEISDKKSNEPNTVGEFAYIIIIVI